jgi:hypothetical protein
MCESAAGIGSRCALHVGELFHLVGAHVEAFRHLASLTRFAGSHLTPMIGRRLRA